MQKLVEDGIVIYEEGTRKYHMPNGNSIMRRGEETISEAALRIRSMSLRPMGETSSNFVTLNNDIQNYYQQVDYDEDSDDEYELDEDEGPYWKIALQTAQDNRIYEDDEYENEEDGYYIDPSYYAYPAERSSTRIAEAREKASRLPSRTPPKQKFEGVFPPPRKNQVKAGQNLPPKQVVPQLPPVQRPQQVPQSAPAHRPQPVPPPAQFPPKPTPLAPRNQLPVDARRPRTTEDVEMRDVQPIPSKSHNPPHAQSHNPIPHVTTKEIPEKSRTPARQSELSSQISTKSVVSEILNTEVQLTLGKLLGASKEISLDLQECLRP